MTEILNEKFIVYPIGYIRRGPPLLLEILEPFRPALRQLDHFSHVMVFWWAHMHDNEESRSIVQTSPPYARNRVT